ncbi:MAG: hypothetical protein M3Z20_21685 [Chloroflexota bacterium]|nr:hypothetical protein [Chloroflexota bacterium]
MYLVPDAAIPFGFSNGPGGPHDSRTIMLGDLRALLAAVPPNAPYSEYACAVVEENVLGKRTVANRKGTFGRLRELYALSPELPVVQGLRTLWDANPETQPMLALLCASARDPLLRATAPLVLQTPLGEPVTRESLSAVLEYAFPGRYSQKSLVSNAQNTASSWRQSGHLQGRVKKTRVRALAQPESTAYALYLGYLCGAGGEALFSTFWAQLLDAPAHALHEQAKIAAQRGWIAYRSLGGVTEVEFPHLPRVEGRA